MPSVAGEEYVSVKSPFFRPNDNKPNLSQTPGGTRRLRRKREPSEEEHKSTVLGCSANLINAIVGSGIVGLPFAIKEAGFCAGIVLVILCGFLTEKSLRLLVETAKHAHVPSYETLAEAAYGRAGFLFVAINMFIMAYGAMLSYLMIVKDTFSDIMGISKEDLAARRAVLVFVSMLIMVPLSSQRDVADLAKTSRINVTFDLIMVGLVLYLADLPNAWKDFHWKDAAIVHFDTIFVGLGVLSFAFVCQHSAFIIAGSLEKPTKDRWAFVTHGAVGFAALLALAMGVGGYIGFKEETQGNILNSLPTDSALADVARGLLGTTMLFVYPMESFVARHACVVLLFQGRQAHEGDDTSVLNRRDRRITLTFALYLSAVVPAAIFENLGNVLAATGAVGGSCLSYIGPGIVFIGIHGGRFVELSNSFFGSRTAPEHPLSELTLKDCHSEGEKEETAPLQSDTIAFYNKTTDLWPLQQMKNVLWYMICMPFWHSMAVAGKGSLTSHASKLALQSPHPIRIGNVKFSCSKLKKDGNRAGEMKKQGFKIKQSLLRGDSLPKSCVIQQTSQSIQSSSPSFATNQIESDYESCVTKKHVYQSINQEIGSTARQNEEEDQLAIEEDPQQDPPSVLDFMIAIFYVIFGILAMAAGLLSIFV